MISFDLSSSLVRPRMSRAYYLVTKRPFILSLFSATCLRHLQQNFFIEFLERFFNKYLKTFCWRWNRVRGPMNVRCILLQGVFSAVSSTRVQDFCFFIKFELFLLNLNFFFSSESASIVTALLQCLFQRVLDFEQMRTFFFVYLRFSLIGSYMGA